MLVTNYLIVHCTQISTTIADELYSETLKQSNVEVGQLSNAETKNFDSNGMNSNLEYFSFVIALLVHIFR